jgi:hypothetical protein
MAHEYVHRKEQVRRGSGSSAYSPIQRRENGGVSGISLDISEKKLWRASYCGAEAGGHRNTGRRIAHHINNLLMGILEIFPELMLSIGAPLP